MLKCVRIALCVLGVAAAAGCPAPSPRAGGPAIQRLAAKVTLKSRDDRAVPFVLENDTDEPLRYNLQAGELTSLEVSLWLDGRGIPKFPIGGPTVGEQPAPNIKEVPARGAVELWHTLRHRKLEPGLYKAYFKYEVYKGSGADTVWGLTPVKLEQVIYIKVPD